MISEGKFDRSGKRIRPFMLFVAALLASLAHAQTHWLDKFDGIQTCHIVDVVADAAGNTYATGDLNSSMTVSLDGSAQGTITTAGAQDVLVAKFAPDGSLLWSIHAGGPAVDLGLKIALAPGGVAVTGIFTGTADLFGTTVNAQGGGTDLFVAMLDLANGQAQWVRTAGSPGYADTPGGITVTSSGGVVVAGKFKGDAVFGSQVLHSAIDPATAMPSFDVFIAAWAADGTFQWVKQGTGPKDCLAVDIVSAPDDHLYVTGQFSDTLTFDVMHPTTVINNIFLAKFDPQGNELWFRQLGGATINHVSDLRWSTANDLLLTGDQSGTMFWSGGGGSTPVPSADAFAYFILRASASGALLDATAIGSAAAMHAASITEQADSVVVFGEFACSFTGLQTAYGASGLFMATGPSDLFIAKHAATDLGFVRAQQFSGPSAKSAGAIANGPIGLVFSGSFSTRLFLPRGTTGWGDPAPPCSFLPANDGASYCGDPNYGSFAWATGAAVATGFLTAGHVEGRQPYDFWERAGTPPCDRSDRSAELRILYNGVDAPDTVHACSKAFFSTLVPFPRGTIDPCPVEAPTVGPFGQQFWSNGTAFDTTTVFSTGWLRYTVFNTSGCGPWKDSVYVDLTLGPTLIVTDSTGAYHDYSLPSPPNTITTCDPMVFWASQLAPTDQAYWVVGTDTIFSDTVHIATSGTYHLHVVAANGCIAIGSLVVTVTPHVDVNITGVTSQLAAGDTIYTCSAGCITGSFSNTWYVDGVQATLPNGLLMTYASTGGCNQVGITDAYQPVPWGLYLTGSGWYVVHSDVSVVDGGCTTGLYSFTFTDSVYVAIGAVADFAFASGLVQHCDGDTVAIPFICSNCDTIYWSGPGIVGLSPGGGSLLVDADGAYHALPITSVNGSPCAGSNQDVIVTGPTPPNLFTNPASGTVCPNDSVQLSTDAFGSDYIWTGPGTDSLPHASSIWLDEPGDYYLTVELNAGCTASNGPVTVAFFGSPIITGPPTGVLCPGGSVQLQVDAGPNSMVQWQPPLSGSTPVQTVSAPGTYTCTVVSCGNSWSLSYTVLLSLVNASLGADTFALCQGQPITLTGPAGAAGYYWLPSGSSQQQLVVSAPGNYELVVTDAAGCTASSGPVAVVEQSVTQPATAAGDSLCAGEVATLQGAGSGDLAWYASADTLNLLDTGAVLTFQPTATDTVFLLQEENGCAGAFLPVLVFVQDTPSAPVILGDSLYCTGDPFLLVAQVTIGAVSAWSAPWGTYVGDTIGPAFADVMHAGAYACYVTLNGCAGDTARLTVSVMDTPGLPVIIGDTLVCIGDTLFLHTSGNVADEWIWTTPGGPFDGDLLVVPDMADADFGLYACQAILGSCISDTVFHWVRLADCTTVLPPGEIPNVITPNGDGVNDVFHFAGEGFSRAELHVFNRWGQQVALALGRNAVWDGRNSYSGEVLDEGVYFYTIEAVTNAGEDQRKAGYVQILR